MVFKNGRLESGYIAPERDEFISDLRNHVVKADIWVDVLNGMIDSIIDRIDRMVVRHGASPSSSMASRGSFASIALSR